MGMTMTQKILAAHAGLAEVKAGQLIEADLDLVLGNDITTPVAVNEMKKMDNQTVFNHDKIALVMDHFIPNKDIKSAENCKCCREFACRHDITNYFDVGEMGIEHALLPEKGLVVAGDAVIGADSHTCTYGALGAFSTGVGSTDMAAGMVTGKAWFKVPSAIKFNLIGKPAKWVSGKDVILHIIGMIGVDGALYRSMEFVGEGADGAEIRSYAEERKLSDRCFFTGAISDREIIRAWYGRSDLFLFPSTFDTNGLVVREAAASGTATVMIRNSCASEGVGDGRNGFCIEENAAAMAAKLEELCRAPEVMQVVGENAQRELYVSWETAVQRAMARYEVVIDNYRSGKYPKRERFGDEFFKTQGGLMKAFASVSELSEEIAAGLRIERDEALQTIVRSRQELHGRFGETKQELAERYETILQKVDRYL